MSKIPPSLIPNDLLTQNQSKQIKASSADFDALLFNSDSSLSFMNDFVDNIISSQSTDSDATLPESGKFPLSSAFTSTFGTGGPLPAWINMVTAKLKLNSSQNQAIQQIAVNNKDATRTPTSIQKIAAELKAAGIQYA